jgi:hypothetical protein
VVAAAARQTFAPVGAAQALVGTPRACLLAIGVVVTLRAGAGEVECVELPVQATVAREAAAGVVAGGAEVGARQAGGIIKEHSNGVVEMLTAGAGALGGVVEAMAAGGTPGAVVGGG